MPSPAIGLPFHTGRSLDFSPSAQKRIVAETRQFMYDQRKTRDSNPQGCYTVPTFQAGCSPFAYLPYRYRDRIPYHAFDAIPTDVRKTRDSNPQSREAPLFSRQIAFHSRIFQMPAESHFRPGRDLYTTSTTQYAKPRTLSS